MIRKSLLAGLTAGMLIVLMLQPASAVFGRNTFQHDAYLDTNVRHLWVTAQIACTAGERVSVLVTVSQGSTLAVGRGRADTVCEPVDFNDPEAFQDIPVRVIALGRNSFGPGEAVAAGFATTRYRGQLTDIRQWQPAAGITIHQTQ
jgi:hypothetical protein